MSEKVNEVKSAVDTVLDRIKELNETRSLIETKKSEIETHKSDLNAIETINGVGSNEWKVKNEILNSAISDEQKLEDKLTTLNFKKSELKPVLDELAKEFEKTLKEEQEREYHIEIGTTDEETGKTNGKKVFKELLDYVLHDVEWTAKSAPGLMMLDRNMQENKAWVQSKDFDGVIILRSANVLVLWRSVLEDMHGKGSLEARKFLSCWANCGKAITDAVRDIQSKHETTRVLGANLNTVEDEFNKSFDDLPVEETKTETIQDEVAPEV